VLIAKEMGKDMQLMCEYATRTVQKLAYCRLNYLLFYLLFDIVINFVIPAFGTIKHKKTDSGTCRIRFFISAIR